MKATQLPVVVNNATTGHKLQGIGIVCLFVHNWSYVRNCDNDQQRLIMVNCWLEEWQDGVEKEVTKVNGCVDLQEGAQPSYSMCSTQKWRSKVPGAGASTADHRRGET